MTTTFQQRDILKSPIGDYYHDNFTNKNPLRILLLEDLDSDAELITYFIGEISIPYVLQHVKNKGDFFIEVEKFNPHFVVSDFQLPQFSGKEALVFIRKRSVHLPFIICTGRINEETAVECIKLGADDYVLKDDLARLPSAITSSISSKKIMIEKEVVTAELLQSEESLRAITNNSPSNIYTIDRNAKIVFFNNSNKEDKVEIGKSIFDYINPKDYDVLKENIEICFNHNTDVEFELEGYTNRRTDWYLCKMGPILKDGVVTNLVLIPNKITELKKAHQDLNELNKRLNLLNNHLENVRDQEKKKIAMEIHDQLGQELTGNKLGLYWLKQNLKESSPEINDKIDDLIDLSTQIIGTVRRIAHELRPVVLDDIGLIAALEWHVNNYNKFRDIDCVLHIDCECDEFDIDLSTSIYRIVQEALTNVDKHAQASSVNIHLFERNDVLKLSIADNGKGLNKEEALNSSSMGLFSIQERIKAWNGQFDITSGDSGTIINIEISLK